MMLLKILVSGWMLISMLLTVIHIYDDPDSVNSVPTLKGWLVGVGALIGFGWLFTKGFEGLLFFMPDTWGTLDEDGDFSSYKYSLSLFLGSILALLVIFIILPQAARQQRKKSSEN